MSFFHPVSQEMKFKEGKIKKEYDKCSHYAEFAFLKSHSPLCKPEFYIDINHKEIRSQ